jgi:sigma-B regulation protein RsbU (phosphoserine phosphatase)
MGSGFESSFHEGVVPLGDDGIQQEIGAPGQAGDVLDIARVYLHGSGLPRAPSGLHFLSAGHVPVTQNDLVHRRTSPEKFVTFIATLYDPETGAIVYSNAGHNPGIVLRAGGGHELLGAQGPPLGLFPGQAYGSGSLTLSSGDLLVLYTDGVTEAANPDDDEFGIDRLVESVRNVASRPLAEIEGALGEGLAAFAAGVPFHDDRTVVLLRRL